ncbi:hypothetical protein H4R34_002469 [Dimargaris verticillata]|uniref:Major facilitator superfamily (MFS) profile domain-containing protein n=1 Tax=Dimargaris verticillata TaxID=2761393 RepID=A0A9W8B6G6_9FUNG|nr:hypothetical protein H4R34_002469 [Dimargaris verticillata]
MGTSAVHPAALPDKISIAIPSRRAISRDPLLEPQTSQGVTSEAPSPSSEQTVDSIITRIGFGKFQRRMLWLCGLGWLADNMWLQCVANILPRVQRHFGVHDQAIGMMFSAIFTGMMVGALFWGTFADRYGRKQAFTWTLCLSTGFGLAASVAPSFPWLCCLLFGLGLGVGGNMPVDGAIFLEFIPHTHRYLLTLLSVFFSAGAVVASMAALLWLPSFSCPPELDHKTTRGVPITASLATTCDVHQENNGWRYLLFTLGVLNGGMLLARVAFFRSQESPKFLVRHNRCEDAVVVLQHIVRYNGDDMDISMRDFSRHSEDSSCSDSVTSYSPRRTCTSVRGLIDGWLHPFRPLFAPRLRRTTLLVWSIWALVALGYTMVNAFLPKLLEARNSPIAAAAHASTAPDLAAVYRQALVYALGSLPGPLVGAFLVQTILRRRGSMAACAFGAALALGVFASSPAGWATTTSSTLFNLLAGTMYAIIYSYTPEVFDTALRGSACGIASALGRVAGILAPLLAGWLWRWSAQALLYTSMLTLGIAGLHMIALPAESQVVVTTL